MNKVWLTVKKQLRSGIRDKKSLFMMFITPLFIPIFVFFFSYMFDTMMEKVENDTYAVAVNYELTDIEKELTETLRLDIVYLDPDDMHTAYENE